MTTKVLVVGADPARAELLDEWLTLESCSAVAERPDVVLVDVPLPRELASQRLKHIGYEHPGAPVLPMPKPLTGEAFVAQYSDLPAANDSFPRCWRRSIAKPCER